MLQDLDYLLSEELNRGQRERQHRKSNELVFDLQN